MILLLVVIVLSIGIGVAAVVYRNQLQQRKHKETSTKNEPEVSGEALPLINEGQAARHQDLGDDIEIGDESFGSFSENSLREVGRNVDYNNSNSSSKISNAKGNGRENDANRKLENKSSGASQRKDELTITDKHKEHSSDRSNVVTSESNFTALANEMMESTGPQQNLIAMPNVNNSWMDGASPDASQGLNLSTTFVPRPHRRQNDESAQVGGFADAFKAIRLGLGSKDDDFEFEEAEFNLDLAAKNLGPAVELLINKEDGQKRAITKDELSHAKVVRFDSCKNCEFVLPKDLESIVKVFVENCEAFQLTIECRIVTRHVEIARCEKLVLNVKTRIDTLQIDISKDVQVISDRRSCRKIFHAGVQQLQVCSEDTDTCIMHDYRFPDDPPVHLLLQGDKKEPSPEDQYLTRFVGNELKTERVHYKDNSLLPTTAKGDDQCDINDNIRRQESFS